MRTQHTDGTAVDAQIDLCVVSIGLAADAAYAGVVSIGITCDTKHFTVVDAFFHCDSAVKITGNTANSIANIRRAAYHAAEGQVRRS